MSVRAMLPGAWLVAGGVGLACLVVECLKEWLMPCRATNPRLSGGFKVRRIGVANKVFDGCCKESAK